MTKTGYINLDTNKESKSNKKLYVSIVIFVVGGLAVTTLFLSSAPNQNKKSKNVLRQTGTNETVTVSTNNGRLKGAVHKSRDGREYFQFYNIPYAKPPVGQLRFEPPQEYSGRWSGTRDATKPGERCIQRKIGSDTVRGIEDCLYLTVITPQRPGRNPKGSSATKLPVMFYIFGGGFVGGSGAVYGGEYFMDTDVVLVIPEFRVGIMGHMNTQDEEGIVKGNMGFKDQIMALKWVQKNIAKFGGDPKKVTLFGNSSGGMSIHVHIFSNMTKGLFHRAISQSGSSLVADAVDTNPRQRAIDVALAVGCTEQQVNVTQTLVDCLKAANASAIVQEQDSKFTGLTIEVWGKGDVDADQIFMSDTPLNLMERGEIVSHVPWILGINSAEKNPQAISLTNSSAVDLLNSKWDQIAPLLLNLDPASNVSEVKQFYFGDKPIDLKTRWPFVNMASDRAWVHPTYVTALLYAQQSSSPVYLYWLNYEGDHSESMKKAGLEPPYGVAHGEEVKYLFNYSRYPYIDSNSEHANFSRVMVNSWARFASGVDPYILENGEEWTRFDWKKDTLDLEWMELNENPKMVKVLGDRMNFWDENFELDELYLG